MEHLFLSGITAGDKLNVVHQENVSAAVFFTEFLIAALTDGLDQFIGEGIAFDIDDFIIGMTLMNGMDAPKTLPVGLLNLMQAQQSAAQYGMMYAGLVMVMLPTLILYICVQKQLTQGMTVGGIKG